MADLTKFIWDSFSIAVNPDGLRMLAVFWFYLGSICAITGIFSKNRKVLYTLAAICLLASIAASNLSLLYPIDTEDQKELDTKKKDATPI